MWNKPPPSRNIHLVELSSHLGGFPWWITISDIELFRWLNKTPNKHDHIISHIYLVPLISSLKHAPLCRMSKKNTRPETTKYDDSYRATPMRQLGIRWFCECSLFHERTCPQHWGSIYPISHMQHVSNNHYITTWFPTFSRPCKKCTLYGQKMSMPLQRNDDFANVARENVSSWFQKTTCFFTLSSSSSSSSSWSWIIIIIIIIIMDHHHHHHHHHGHESSSSSWSLVIIIMVISHHHHHGSSWSSSTSSSWSSCIIISSSSWPSWIIIIIIIIMVISHHHHGH